MTDVYERLSYILATDNIDKLRLMVNNGKFNIQNHRVDGMTMLMRAIYEHAEKSINYLLPESDVDFISASNMTALLMAVQDRNVNLVEKILPYANKSINHTHSDDCGVLHRSLRNKIWWVGEDLRVTEVFKKLLDRTDRQLLRNNFAINASCFHIAADEDSVELLKLLVKHYNNNSILFERSDNNLTLLEYGKENKVSEDLLEYITATMEQHILNDKITPGLTEKRSTRKV